MTLHATLPNGPYGKLGVSNSGKIINTTDSCKTIHDTGQCLLWQTCLLLTVYNWGNPEQASHKCEVCALYLSVCCSVRTFMTRKYTRVVLILRRTCIYCQERSKLKSITHNG